ncbi:lipoyl(octanoyl) transferase LipB [Cellulomonas edaphi]|uniref:Octanoyltransferase n=1 Tax=Cellulomonas edaphi TaxID=3053468 RepID=A0ABT7S761_9CELL|nr:lipoyl(octanoyl) transferase LipB [Cellulomons edaphi]MDM7831447.1 lipoyl(octanoyl) transferase LipB [Cellulomons edaphi]
MRFDELDLGTRLLPYEPTWQRQREVHEAVVAGDLPDTVLLCEHEDVYTAGRRTASWDRPVDGTPVVDVDRGGRITWHGPGQLVGYPIVRLAQPIDVVRYVRALEEALIRTCADLGLTAIRVDGRSGVWFAADEVDGVARRERKVAAIGVRVSRGVTMHGFALNCEPDLGAFERIVPCGISDADVTSLTVETGRRVTIAEVTPLVRGHLTAALRQVLAAPEPAGVS